VVEARPGDPGIIFAQEGMVQWLAFLVTWNFAIPATSQKKMTVAATATTEKILSRTFLKEMGS
jgi:hypothetical protein